MPVSNFSIERAPYIYKSCFSCKFICAFIQELEAKKKEEEKQQNRSVSFRVKTKEAEASAVGRGALLGSDDEDDNGKDRPTQSFCYKMEIHFRG